MVSFVCLKDPRKVTTARIVSGAMAFAPTFLSLWSTAGHAITLVRRAMVTGSVIWDPVSSWTVRLAFLMLMAIPVMVANLIFYSMP